MPNDCVVNVTQTQVSEGPQSQPASSVREGKEVKGVDQPEDEQLSPLQLRTHQMEDKTICHILGWKEAGNAQSGQASPISTPSLRLTGPSRIPWLLRRECCIIGGS